MIKKIPSMVAVLLMATLSISLSSCMSSKNIYTNAKTTVTDLDVSLSLEDSLSVEGDFENITIKSGRNVLVTPPANMTRVVIQSIEGYGDHEEFAKQYAMLLEKVINSSDFKKKVLANKYKFNNGLTSEEIYTLINKAKETAGPGGADEVIDLRLRTMSLERDGARWMRNCGNSTIGKDGGSTGVTATCPDWIANNAGKGKNSLLAGHYMHEYLHVLGFRHPSKRRKVKIKSVPYKIGYIVRDIVTDYGRPLKGVVTADQKFETKINGDKRVLTLYVSSMHVPDEEKLDLSKYIGKRIKIQTESYIDTEAYGARVVN